MVTETKKTEVKEEQAPEVVTDPVMLTDTLSVLSFWRMKASDGVPVPLILHMPDGSEVEVDAADYVDTTSTFVVEDEDGVRGVIPLSSVMWVELHRPEVKEPTITRRIGPGTGRSGWRGAS